MLWIQNTATTAGPNLSAFAVNSNLICKITTWKSLFLCRCELQHQLLSPRVVFGDYFPDGVPRVKRSFNIWGLFVLSTWQHLCGSHPYIYVTWLYCRKQSDLWHMGRQTIEKHLSYRTAERVLAPPEMLEEIFKRRYLFENHVTEEVTSASSTWKLFAVHR